MEPTNERTIILIATAAIIIFFGGIYWWGNYYSPNTPVVEEQEIIDNEIKDVERPEPLIEISSTTKKPEATIEKLNDLLTTVKVENPENFSYLGCGIIHGPDGVIDNWKNFESHRLENLYSFLNTAASKYTLIKLDYSSNPNNVSDRVHVVTCSCEEYAQAQEMITDLDLHFTDLLWHTDDPKNDPMTPCLGEIPFR